MAAQEPQDYIEANDEGFSDEGTGPEDAQSSLTSLASSIIKGVEENGRTYATYGKEEYGMPMDEREMDRVDMNHAKYYMLLDKKRYLAPISDVHKVLELELEQHPFADQHQSAEVIGVDIALIQPKWIPPNTRFEVDDIEQRWTWQPESFDYIFSRDLYFAIRDWPKLIGKCFEHLKPGGWLEIQGLYGVLGCDDESLPQDSVYREFDKQVRAACRHVGTPLEDAARWKGLFEDAGFEVIVEKIYKIPSNPWAKDPKLRLIGAFELDNFMQGLEGMASRIFEKGLGWSAAETTVFCAKVKNDIRNQRYHSYYPFYVVYGRKPAEAKQ